MLKKDYIWLACMKQVLGENTKYGKVHFYYVCLKQLFVLVCSCQYGRPVIPFKVWLKSLLIQFCTMLLSILIWANMCSHDLRRHVSPEKDVSHKKNFRNLCERATSFFFFFLKWVQIFGITFLLVVQFSPFYLENFQDKEWNLILQKNSFYVAPKCDAHGNEKQKSFLFGLI